MAARFVLMYIPRHNHDEKKTQKVSTWPGSKLDKVHGVCSPKSQHTFIRIRFVCHRSGRSWNGLVVDFMVFTYWGWKTRYFVLVAQYFFIRSRQHRCAADNRRARRIISKVFALSIGDLEIGWLLTSCCHTADRTNRLFWSPTSPTKTQQAAPKTVLRHSKSSLT